MAKKHLVNEERTDTVIIGKEGKPQIRFGLSKKEYELDGNEFLQTDAENIVCGDGTVVNTAMLLQQGKERVVLKLCDDCVAENEASVTPIIPYSPADKMAICHHCNRNLCSRHSHVHEGKSLCKSCKHKLFWKHLLFFKKVTP